MIKSSARSGSSKAAWWSVLIATLLLLTYLLFGFTPANGEPNPFPNILRRILDGRSGDMPWYQAALPTSIFVVLSAQALSLVIGVILGGMALTRWAPLRYLAAVYVETLRGIPIYVMLLFVYFGLTRILPEIQGESIKLSPFQSAVIALGVCYGAFMAEVVRAGIESIPREEIEAGMLEGNSYIVLRHIVLPQALRTILPALMNECIALMKDSAIVGVVALMDMTRAAQIYAGSTFRYFEAFALLGLIYLLLSLIFSGVQAVLERNFGSHVVS